MIECARVGKWFGGCRFEPRYDEPVLSTTEQTLGRDGRWERLEGTDRFVYRVPPLGDRTYIHDVCIRCGKIAAPPSPTKEI